MAFSGLHTHLQLKSSLWFFSRVSLFAYTSFSSISVAMERNWSITHSKFNFWIGKNVCNITTCLIGLLLLLNNIRTKRWCSGLSALSRETEEWIHGGSGKGKQSLLIDSLPLAGRGPKWVAAKTLRLGVDICPPGFWLVLQQQLSV